MGVSALQLGMQGTTRPTTEKVDQLDEKKQDTGDQDGLFDWKEEDDEDQGGMSAELNSCQGPDFFTQEAKFEQKLKVLRDQHLRKNKTDRLKVIQNKEDSEKEVDTLKKGVMQSWENLDDELIKIVTCKEISALVLDYVKCDDNLEKHMLQLLTSRLKTQCASPSKFQSLKEEFELAEVKLMLMQQMWEYDEWDAAKKKWFKRINHSASNVNVTPASTSGSKRRIVGKIIKKLFKAQSWKVFEPEFSDINALRQRARAVDLLREDPIEEILEVIAGRVRKASLNKYLLTEIETMKDEQFLESLPETLRSLLRTRREGEEIL